jgi:hypothetical protein
MPPLLNFLGSIVAHGAHRPARREAVRISDDRRKWIVQEGVDEADSPALVKIDVVVVALTPA